MMVVTGEPLRFLFNMEDIPVLVGQLKLCRSSKSKVNRLPWIYLKERCKATGIVRQVFHQGWCGFPGKLHILSTYPRW